MWGEPIQARPISTTERVAKWIDRRPATAALAGLLGVALVAGIAGVLWQFWEAVAAREKRAMPWRRRGATRPVPTGTPCSPSCQAYIANINLAGRSWDDAHIDQVKKRLEEAEPRSGRPDLRGFEWHYLDRLCHGDEAILQGHSSGVTAIAYGPDGRSLASASSDRTIKLWETSSLRRACAPSPPPSAASTT